MDRKGQLGNVAFGGAWSERIPRREALNRALEVVRAAPSRTAEEDLRLDPSLVEALAAVAAAHPRGPALTRAWERALDQVQPDMRAQELSRLAAIFAAWIRDHA